MRNRFLGLLILLLSSSSLLMAQGDTLGMEGYIIRLKMEVKGDSASFMGTDYLWVSQLPPENLPADSILSWLEKETEILFVNCKYVLQARKKKDDFYGFIAAFENISPQSIESNGLVLGSYKALPVLIEVVPWGTGDDMNIYKTMALISTCHSNTNHGLFKPQSQEILSPRKVSLR